MKESGFSLVEILVVIGVTVTLTVMAIGFSRTSQTQLEAFRGQSEVVGVINRAKSLTLERFSDSGISGRDVCGVGIRFSDQKNYHLFQDIEGSGDCSLSDKEYSGSSEDLESFSLGPQVSFSAGTPGLEILFLAPHLDVVASREFPVEFRIGLDGEGDVSIIEISAVGQVSLQEIN